MTPSTVATWTLNGSTTEFDVPFDYLSRTYVKITLIGPVPKPLVLGTDFQFITPTRIQTFQAYGPPAYNLIEVRRETSTTERLVEFHDASILTAIDLNTADIQVMHVAEEARNSATETLGVNNDGNLDARGRRIVNLADSREDGDAMNYGMYRRDVNGTLTARVAAEAARDKAREWATKATPVEASLESAKTYAERAKASEGVSTSNASSAAGSAQTAVTKAAESASSAVMAQAWAAGDGYVPGTSLYSARSYNIETARLTQVAATWAENPINVPVEPGKFSAKHWAAKAEDWAQDVGEVPQSVHKVTQAVRALYSGLIGVPVPWPSATIPDGYVIMFGQAVPADCPILAARYPSGFLPDMRDHFVRGQPEAGRELLSKEADGNKAHSHTGTASSAGGHSHTVNGSTNTTGAHTHSTTAGGLAQARGPDYDPRNFTGYNGSARTGSDGNHSHSVTGTAETNGAHSHTVTVEASGDTQARPKNITFLYICMTDKAIPALPTTGS